MWYAICDYSQKLQPEVPEQMARLYIVPFKEGFTHLQDERNDGITPSAGGLKPFSSAKIRITGARQSDRMTKRQTRWQGWQVN